MTVDAFTLMVVAVLFVAMLKLSLDLRGSIEASRVINTKQLEAITRLEVVLRRMEKHTGEVADDLAAAVGRADAADDATPGASADAALRTGQ